MEEKNKSGMGVASLVLGIISIITAMFYYITLPTGILAIVFGAKSIKRFGSKLRKSRSSNRNSRIIYICIYIHKHNINTYCRNNVK